MTAICFGGTLDLRQLKAEGPAGNSFAVVECEISRFFAFRLHLSQSILRCRVPTIPRCEIVLSETVAGASSKSTLQSGGRVIPRCGARLDYRQHRGLIPEPQPRGSRREAFSERRLPRLSSERGRKSLQASTNALRAAKTSVGVAKKCRFRIPLLAFSREPWRQGCERDID